MATRNPLEDFLNSEVDESAISALVGSLETQLASPTARDPPAQNSATSTSSNHVHGPQVGSTLQHGQPVQAPVGPTLKAPPGQVQITNANGGKDPHLIALNSVGNATNAVVTNSNVNSTHSNASANVIHHNPVTISSTTSGGTSQSVSSGAGFLPKQVIVSIGSTNAGTVVLGATQNNVVYANSLTNNSATVGGTAITVNSSVPGNSAIYDLASIAAEQQRLTVPGSGPLDIKPPLATTAPLTVRAQLEQRKDEKPPQQMVVVQQPHVQPTQAKPQFVVKREPSVPVQTSGAAVNVGGVPYNAVKQEVKFITQPQVSQLQTVNMTRPVAPAANVPATSNVITITKAMSTPQTMAVLRQSASSQQQQQIQIVSANTPRAAVPVNVNQKLAPRINAAQPVRIAPQQQPSTIRAPTNLGATISLPPGLTLPPGAMVVKNEQGQLMVIQQPTGGVQPGPATQGAVRIIRPGLPAGSVPQTIQVSQPQAQVSMAMRPTATTIVSRPQMTHHTAAPRLGLRAQAPVRFPAAQPRPQVAPRVTSAPSTPGRMGFQPRPGPHPTTISATRAPNLPSGLHHPGTPHMRPPGMGHSHMGPRTTSPHMRLPATGSPLMGHPGPLRSASPHMAGSPHTRPTLPGSPHTPASPVPGSPLGSPHIRSPFQQHGEPQHPHHRGLSPGGLRPPSPAPPPTAGLSGFHPGAPPQQPGRPQDTLSASPGAASPGGQSNVPVSKYMLENVRKCKNFLSTLLKLAASQPQNTVSNVRQLIQGLIDGRVEPEAFTDRLQVELKSSPQPYLVPFLKKSLPLLRQSMVMSRMHIDGVRPPPAEVLRQSGMAPPAVAQPPRPHAPVRPGQQVPKVSPASLRAPLTNHQLQQLMINQRLGAGAASKLQPNQTRALLVRGQTPKPATVNLSGVAAVSKEKRKYESLKDDDDINDVATMGGVNLTEESRNILATNSELMAGQLRSCKDENFLASGPLAARINAIAKKHGLDEAPQGVLSLMSHATQERLRNIVERLATIAEHRIEVYKTDTKYETTSEVRLQLRFLEDLDRQEKKRHEEAEREVLLRAAKSRSKHEDPEQLKLKEKAKAMQQAELEEVRQREANLTALAAIGPRKKKPKLEGPDTGGTSGSQASSTSRPGGPPRPRIKQVKLRDLMFMLEQERETNRSSLLYQAYLKN